MAEYIDIDDYIKRQAEILSKNGGFLGMTSVINFLFYHGINPVVGLNMILAAINTVKMAKYINNDSDDELAVSDNETSNSDDESVNSCDEEC